MWVFVLLFGGAFLAIESGIYFRDSDDEKEKKKKKK
jgi:hypothetical protein